MTNSDVEIKENHHKKATTWDSVHKPKSKESKSNVKEPIRGPKTTKPEPHTEPEPEPEPENGGKGKSVYPDIYGPDITTAPGNNNLLFQDSSNPSPVDFIPAREFPSGPMSPSPFLNDFSKIMK